MILVASILPLFLQIIQPLLLSFNPLLAEKSPFSPTHILAECAKHKGSQVGRGDQTVTIIWLVLPWWRGNDCYKKSGALGLGCLRCGTCRSITGCQRVSVILKCWSIIREREGKSRTTVDSRLHSCQSLGWCLCEKKQGERLSSQRVNGRIYTISHLTSYFKLLQFIWEQSAHSKACSFGVLFL